MSSYFELDVQYAKKDDNKKFQFLDRRKFRAQQSDEEKLLKNLMESFDNFGVSDSLNISRSLLYMKNIFQLNKNLLVVAYLYFQKKKFDPGRIGENFDEDFQEILQLISSKKLFSKIFEKSLEFEFRQDFITYLLMIKDFLEEESSADSSYYDDGYDVTVEEIFDETDKPPQELEDYNE